MKTIDTISLSEHLDQQVTGLVTCWIIERQDGRMYRFTDATEDLTVDGDVYSSVGAYKRTAIETTSTLSVDNLDVIGLAGDLSLPEKDLRNGLFDNARISVFMCAWSAAVPGKIRLRRGFFGEVQTLPNGTFQVELRGLMQRLAYNYLDMYSATCLYDLGEPACGVVIRPEQVKRSTFYNVGDVVLAARSAAVSLDLRYPMTIPDASFEGLSVSGFASSVNWFDVGANPMITTGAQALSGSVSLATNGGAGATRQIIALEDASDLPQSLVASGNAEMSLNGFWITGGTTGRYQIQFYDNDFNIIVGGYDSGDVSVGASWTQFQSPAIAVPTTAKQVSITLSGAGAGVLFDSIRGFFYDETQRDPVFLPSDTGNVYYECTNDGTTSSVYPGTFTGSGTAVDGGVIWTARNAFLRSGVVLTADNRRTFTAVIEEPRAVDAWFNGGSVLFITGENAGVAMELKQWRQTNGEIELFLSMPSDINTGDEFFLYPGCDKSRISCAAIFRNGPNFYGFPDVPGQDDFLKYPDSKA